MQMPTLKLKYKLILNQIQKPPNKLKLRLKLKLKLKPKLKLKLRLILVLKIKKMMMINKLNKMKLIKLYYQLCKKILNLL